MIIGSKILKTRILDVEDLRDEKPLLAKHFVIST
jgi:hypothetical protein